MLAVARGLVEESVISAPDQLRVPNWRGTNATALGSQMSPIPKRMEVERCTTRWRHSYGFSPEHAAQLRLGPNSYPPPYSEACQFHLRLNAERALWPIPGMGSQLDTSASTGKR